MLSTPTPAPDFSLDRVGGGRRGLPDYRGQRLALLFYRFAGCPVCNLHVREHVRRRAELQAAGLRLVTVFHSPLAELEARMREGEVPFDILADPEKTAYRAYEVEQSWAGMMSPRFMGQAMRGMLGGFAASPFGQTGGMTGLPASFLIDPEGVVRLAHYGRHAGDAWDPDALLHASRVTFGDAPDPAADAAATGA